MGTTHEGKRGAMSILQHRVDPCDNSDMKSVTSESTNESSIPFLRGLNLL